MNFQRATGSAAVQVTLATKMQARHHAVNLAPVSNFDQTKDGILVPSARRETAISDMGVNAAGFVNVDWEGATVQSVRH